MKIIAENHEQFSGIEKAIKSLPEEVCSQIEQAEESLMGTQCTLREAYGESNRIFLPHPIDQVINLDNEDRVACGDFIFIIPKRGNPKIHYTATPVIRK